MLNKNPTPIPEHPFQDWASASLGDLVANINSVHHVNTRHMLHEASMLMAHLKSDRRAIQMDGMSWRLHTFATQMRTHLDQEEVVLFPICIDLEKQCAGVAVLLEPLAVIRTVHALTEGHAGAVESLADLISLSSALDEAASQAVASLRKVLTDLDLDMREHGRLEEILLSSVMLLQQRALNMDTLKTTNYSCNVRDMDRDADALP